MSQADLRGDITDTGGEDLDERGFVYDTSSHGGPGNLSPSNSSYASNVTETSGPYGTGNFTITETGLSTGTTYYYRAVGHNSAGWSYGDEVSFTTNAVPTASLSVSNGDNDLDVTADASGSSDPDGDSLTYDYDWGDGTTDTNAGSTQQHTYSSAGTYTVTVTVTDTSSASDTASDTITVDIDDVQVNDGGTWKTADDIYVNDGGTWKECKEVYVNDGGTWKKVYEDPNA